MSDAPQPKSKGYWWRLGALIVAITIVAIAANFAITKWLGYSTPASLLKGLVLAAACLSGSLFVRVLR